VTQAIEFLDALAAGSLEDEERLILCGFVGDPETAGPTAWAPRPWKTDRDVPFNDRANVYVTVGAFGRAQDGSFRRRTETFKAGLALMVDDVGTKVDPAAIDDSGLRPSAIVETSQGNFQWWYFIERELDAPKFDGVIRAFITSRLLGADPGMSGITRVGRVPAFVNGKKKHNNWRCVLHSLEGHRYHIDDLLAGFKLTINGRRELRQKLVTEDAIERNRNFAAMFKFLQSHKMLKREEPDASGWVEMTCPWVEDHTNRVDNGAAIREPAEENDFWGAFRCFHGHCMDKGWSDLTDWIAEQAAEELNN
jgi:hypothetical protein